MHHRDLTPLLRATVGFDRMMNMLDTAGRIESSAPSYPPYNIEKTDENSYRITMAVAGFSEEELEITVKENSLHVGGNMGKTEDETVTYLHRGIATRSFQRSFDLADHIKITAAHLENGLLTIELAREIPEAKKPRNIPITKMADRSAELLDS
ncbi:Hsp20 family protein [Kiloniella laminariae]|uniref:Hsp20 family protein n=2 Tax=Kiloniella laminariae TaxID=454162 RepID=A0ABT4LIB2_9PROT|nr:Hsp20 family protein [Kiloniella laminariae]MCZ4280835.1 Hsp20 family protein [Kiloniella laminariae]